MRTALRGRVATRGVALAAVLVLVAAGAAFLVVRAPDAGAEDLAPTGPSVRILALRDAAVTAGDDIGTTVALGATVAPPPLPPPVFCPAPGTQFVDSWGFSRSGGRRHKGVDMMGPHGSPVVAPLDGFVEPSNSSLGGIGFYLYDEAGNEYFGSHLASLDVTGWVEAGQQIGTVGSTGNAGTPHLHFEVKPAGSGSVNPFPFALDWCTSDFSVPGAQPLLP